MKRIAALILTILYFLTSTGATMNHHYCMGEMINSSLWMNKEKKCGKCGMEDNKSENNGCCNDEQQWVKIKDDQKANSVEFELSKLQLTVLSIFLFYSDTLTTQESLLSPESKALQRSRELPTYLINGVFRI